jgi:glycosyltransferase involved in cell wall biosynthesis
VSVSVGICAFNEEALIADVLHAFLTQTCRRARIDEIVLVCCGSTDSTGSIARAIAANGDLVSVFDRGERRGKTAAINELLRVCRGDVVIIAGGDTVPRPDVTERLVAALCDDPTVGMAGPRPVPEPSTSWLCSYLNRTLWLMHDAVAVRSPKLGEVVAVRRSLVALLPEDVYCDEVALEALVTSSGARLAYVRDAVVQTFSPGRLREIYGQRRRIYCQHTAARRLLGYRPATASARLVVPAVLSFAARHPQRLAGVSMLCVIEGLARTHGLLDYRSGRRYAMWTPVERPISSEGAA